MTWMSVATSDWDAYTVFSVIAGLCLMALAFLPNQRPSGQIVNVVVGVAFIVYGVWTAHQTAGTYYFPVAIFIIPFAVGIKAVSSLARTSTQRTPTPQRLQPPSTPYQAAPYGDGVAQNPSTPSVRLAPAHAQPPSSFAPPQPQAPVTAIRDAVTPAPVDLPLERIPSRPPPTTGSPRIVISYDDLD